MFTHASMKYIHICTYMYMLFDDIIYLLHSIFLPTPAHISIPSFQQFQHPPGRMDTDQDTAGIFEGTVGLSWHGWACDRKVHSIE